MLFDKSGLDSAFRPCSIHSSVGAQCSAKKENVEILLGHLYDKQPNGSFTMTTGITGTQGHHRNELGPAWISSRRVTFHK